MMRGAVEARRRPNQFAGARERSRPRPLALPRETGFAPEVSSRETRSSAAFFIRKIIPPARRKDRMAAAAFLIALAASGLILIVLWEVFS
jgi:hypothetical protein